MTSQCAQWSVIARFLYANQPVIVIIYLGASPTSTKKVGIRLGNIGGLLFPFTKWDVPLEHKRQIATFQYH